MKKQLLYLFFFIGFLSNAQKFSTGLVFDSVEFNRSVKKEFETPRAGLPSSFSLTNYLPSVMSQGDLGSCTSWACTYYGMTIVTGVENKYKANPYSPLSTFNRVKTKEGINPCNDEGSSILSTLEILKMKGAPLYFDYNYSNYCNWDYSTNSYSKKLNDWSFVSVNKEQIKNAISNYSPVIIAMNCYKRTISQNETLYSLGYEFVSTSTGEWTYQYRSSDKNDGAHAMCIVGYDDYKYGGAFLVVNSWGNDWGNKGFFWVKYNQLNTISGAFVMEPKSKPNGNNTIISVNSAYKTKNIQFTNNCERKVYLSLGQETVQGTAAKGWYHIEPYSSITLDISERRKNEIFWMAETSRNPVYSIWSGDAKTFCVTNDAYESSKNSSCSERAVGFRSYIPDNIYITEGQTLTCPNGRGDMESYPYIVVEGDDFELNQNWKGEYPLKDPISGEQIVLNDNKDIFYSVYVIEKESIKQIKVNYSELLELKQLKFSTEKNALFYLKSKRQDSNN